MHKFEHKETGKIYYSTHLGNQFAEKELNLPIGCLKYIEEVKKNACGARFTTNLQFNPKSYLRK
jgi:hypothetical protein